MAWFRLTIVFGISTLFYTPSSIAASVGGIKFPDRPVLSATEYPNCAQNYTKEKSFEARFQSVQDCIGELESYNSIILPDYVLRMKRYVTELQNLSVKILKNKKIKSDFKVELVQYIRNETSSCDANYGQHFLYYRYFIEKYKRHIRILISVRRRFQFPSS